MKLTDYIRGIPTKYWWFIAIRFLSFFIVGFETFFGPKIVGLSHYGQIEFEKQLINLSSILLLGVHSGYGFYYFKNHKSEDTYNFLFVGFFHCILIFIIVSLATQNDLYSFGVVFYLFSVFMEQLLKINNHFNVAILYKPIVSILLIAYYCFYYFFRTNLINFRVDLNGLYMLGLLVFAIPFIGKSTMLEKKKLTLKAYTTFLKKGFEPNLTSSLFILFLFIDRFIIKKYYSSSLGLYSIAYNFSYIAVLIAGSIAYVTTIKFGERMNNNRDLEEYLKKMSKIAMLFIVVNLVIMLPLIYLTHIYWFREKFFCEIAIINLIPKTLFGASAIISPIIFYKGKERFSWVGMLVVIIFTILIDSYVIYSINDYGFWALQLVSGFLLMGYSLYICFVIQNKLKINLI